MYVDEGKGQSNSATFRFTGAAAPQPKESDSVLRGHSNGRAATIAAAIAAAAVKARVG